MSSNSSNLAVVNFSVGGTLVVSGSTTLANPILSSSSGNFQGLSTTTLVVSGLSTFNNSLPTSTQTPTLFSQLTTKVYVDSANTVLNNRITSTDSDQKSYIDSANTVLNNRITSIVSNDNIFTGKQTFSKPIITSTLNNVVSIGSDTNLPNYINNSNAISVGINNLSKLSTGFYNICFGNNNMQELSTGNSNICYGNFNLQLLTTGKNNNCMGSSILSNNTIGSFNSAVGIVSLNDNISGGFNVAIGAFSGQYSDGSYNTFLGSRTGQDFGDLNKYSNSTLIGYNAKLTASNQIVLGTLTEVVICPGSVNITNNMTSGSITTGSITTNNMTSGSVNITNNMTSGSITTNNMTSGSVNITNNMTSGSITTTSITMGNTITSAVWNILSTITSAVGLLSANNSWTGNNTFSNLNCTGYSQFGTVAFGPILRSTPQVCTNDKLYFANNFGINQMLVVNSTGVVFNIELPNPTTCPGQTVNIFNSGTQYNVNFLQTGSAQFVGKKSGTSFQILPGQTINIISSGSNWVVMSI